AVVRGGGAGPDPGAPAGSRGGGGTHGADAGAWLRGEAEYAAHQFLRGKSGGGSAVNGRTGNVHQGALPLGQSAARAGSAGEHAGGGALENPGLAWLRRRGGRHAGRPGGPDRAG